MKDWPVVALVLLWGVFLVCIATFGGKAGADAAGVAGFITGFLIFGYGFWKFMDSV